MSDCHFFPLSGSVKLDLWPVARSHIEEPVTAGDFAWKTSIQTEASLSISKAVQNPYLPLRQAPRVVLGGPLLHSTVPRPQPTHMPPGCTPLPPSHKKNRCQLQGVSCLNQEENERQNPRSGPGRILEKPSLRIRMSSWWAFLVGLESIYLCHSLLYIPKPRLYGEASERVLSSGPAHL